jgi:hypothetical protein
MSNIFESIEGGSVATFLSGDSTPAPVEDLPVEQALPESADTHQVETPAPSQTDATIETPETKPEEATKDTEESSVKESESSDTPQPKEELTGPKALRTAYESLKAEVAPLEPYKDFMKSVVEQEISPVMLQEAKSMFDSFLALEQDSEANATAFLTSLYELSPSAFQKAMVTLVDDNKEYVAKRLGLEAQAETSATVDEEVPVPEFDPETGEPLSEEVRNLIRAANERVKSFNEKERQRAEADKLAADKAAQELAEKQAAEIDKAIDSFRSERLKSIDRTIDNITGLKELPNDTDKVKADKEKLRSIIKGAAISSFGNDSKARTFYQSAVERIAEGKSKLADGLAFNIENAMGSHAKEVAEFLSDLFSRAYKNETAQVQQAATGSRPEVSDSGASVSSGVIDTSKMAPFSDESLRARLANLEASGRFSKR